MEAGRYARTVLFDFSETEINGTTYSIYLHPFILRAQFIRLYTAIPAHTL